jgi:aminopeptidase YwaD
MRGMMHRFQPFTLTFTLIAATFAAETPSRPAAAEANIRSYLEALASDAMNGRQTGTEDERRAAEYIAAQLQKFGVQPAGDATVGGPRSYLQKAPLEQKVLDAAPQLKAGDRSWVHGKDVSFVYLGSDRFHGPLQKLKAGDAVKHGTVVFLTLVEGVSVREQINAPAQAGAAAILVGWSEQLRRRYESSGQSLPELPLEPQPFHIVFLGPEATTQLDQLFEGTEIAFQGHLKDLPPTFTYSVFGVLPGRTDEAILLGAHLDHLGRDPARSGDNIYNGADDDASGCAAVLELARVLSASPKTRRTVYFAFFGGEEIGGVGARYFLEKPPMPLDKLVANIEFEMIGRPDEKVPAKTLWLSGYDRSDLGPELARHGARLVNDPHPEQNFFARSDNYPLAKRGIIAHTVSSFGLHPQYHRVDDDLSHIDFGHMTEAIQSLVEPILWLADSEFRPQWLPGKKP